MLASMCSYFLFAVILLTVAAMAVVVTVLDVVVMTVVVAIATLFCFYPAPDPLPMLFFCMLVFCSDAVAIAQLSDLLSSSLALTPDGTVYIFYHLDHTLNQSLWVIDYPFSTVYTPCMHHCIVIKQQF